ncbi:MAG: TldD/PmbA family protein [Proteobacteria bacterium]|nr:TldD/PmbA family protein [Pseudomonadota bacterium]
MTFEGGDKVRQQLSDLIQKARDRGASAADAVLVEGTSKSVSWHDGKIESLEHSEGADLGLRVFFGKQQAIASSTDRSVAALDELVDRVIAMAKNAPEDPFCRIAEPDQLAKNYLTIEMADDYEIEVSDLIEQAKVAEDAGLAVPGITQSESTDAGAGQTRITLATSNGFVGQYERTSYSISAVMLAGEGTEMERDYDFSAKAFRTDLASPAEIGRLAAEKTVRNLGARKMPSCQVPVVFDPQEASGLIRSFIGAILGSSIARGTSFLKDYMDKPVFAEAITIIDDPHRPRGYRSKPFDGEGIATHPLMLVDQGVLKTWLLDLRSAAQLGLQTTGHAARGTSSMPSPSASNPYVVAGKLTKEELIKDIKSGFYVTETMGMGINGVTGDYSQAARGFWIEEGEISFPVNEMTIAGNLKDMFKVMTPANDLDFRYGVDSPTLRIEHMVVAGLS